MPVPVFILAGQSNVGFLSSGIESAFDEEYGVGNYELVRVFDGGAPLTREREDDLDWSDPDELREQLTVETADALLEDDDRVFGGMIWVQGEADSFFTNGANQYGDELDELIDGFRDDVAAILGESDVGIDQAPVTILELSENAPDAPDRAGWDAVINGQRAVAEDDPLVQTVDPDVVAQDAEVPVWEMFQDGLHYAEDFGNILAEELVQTLIEPQFDETDDEDIDTDEEPELPVIPVVDESPVEDDQDAEANADIDDDGGFGFEAILFLIPFFPLLAAIAG